MEISLASSQSSLAASLVAQAVSQPQEQQARSLRTDREREDVTRANDQVTLSSAARQVATQTTERVTARPEANPVGDRPESENRIEQTRQAQVESRQDDQQTPRSVARALETYTQTAALSSGNG
jgi:hypothetical protein